MKEDPDRRAEIRLWPRGLQRLAELIGPEAALRLAEHYGGLDKLHVPARASLSHPFAQIIGFDNLEKLSAALGNERISIPRGTFRNLKKARILDLVTKGWSSRKIARELGCTERWVQKVRQDGPPDERQLRLF